jgi:hypothetical protein
MFHKAQNKTFKMQKLLHCVQKHKVVCARMNTTTMSPSVSQNSTGIKVQNVNEILFSMLTMDFIPFFNFFHVFIFFYKANTCIHNVLMFITATILIYAKFGLRQAFRAKQLRKLGAPVCCSGVTRLRLWSITSPFYTSQRYSSASANRPRIITFHPVTESQWCLWQWYPYQFIHEPSGWHNSLNNEGRINLRNS